MAVRVQDAVRDTAHSGCGVRVRGLPPEHPANRKTGFVANDTGGGDWEVRVGDSLFVIPAQHDVDRPRIKALDRKLRRLGRRALRVVVITNTVVFEYELQTVRQAGEVCKGCFGVCPAYSRKLGHVYRERCVDSVVEARKDDVTRRYVIEPLFFTGEDLSGVRLSEIT